MIRLFITVDGLQFTNLHKRTFYRPSEITEIEAELKRLRHSKRLLGCSIQIRTVTFPDFESSHQIMEFHKRNHWQAASIMKCRNPVCSKLRRKRERKAKSETI